MYNNTTFVAKFATDYQRAGIDKLVLTTTEFSVSDDLLLNRHEFPKLAGQRFAERDCKPLYHVGKKPIYGEKAYINSERFNLNINQHGMQIILNPSKILHPFELLTNGKDLQRVIEGIETELIDLGVGVSLASMNVARLDIAKQSNMPRLVSHYAPAFDQLKLKGTRSAKVMHNLETFGLRNNSVQACFYDKIREQNPKALPSNFMRAEMRLTKGRAVQNYAGLKRFHEVVKMDEAGWQFVYNRWMQKKIFTLPPEQLTFDYAGLDNLVSHIVSEGQKIEAVSENAEPKKKEQRKNGNIMKAATVIGTHVIFDEIGIDRFMQAWEPYCDRSTIHRARQKLMQHARLSVMIGKPISTLSLIDELKEIFLQAA